MFHVEHSPFSLPEAESSEMDLCFYLKRLWCPDQKLKSISMDIDNFN